MTAPHIIPPTHDEAYAWDDRIGQLDAARRERMERDRALRFRIAVYCGEYRA